MSNVRARDSGEEPAEDRAAALPEADADPDELGVEPGQLGERNRANRLCAKPERSDAQAAELAKLLEARAPPRSGPSRSTRPR